MRYNCSSVTVKIWLWMWHVGKCKEIFLESRTQNVSTRLPRSHGSSNFAWEVSHLADKINYDTFLQYLFNRLRGVKFTPSHWFDVNTVYYCATARQRLGRGVVSWTERRKKSHRLLVNCKSVLSMRSLTVKHRLLPQTNGTDGKPRLWRCAFAIWRVGDQAFGRYRSLKGAEKWSRDDHENCKVARIKIHRFQNAILFALRRKVTKQWRHQALVSAWPSWIDARRQYPSS